MFRSLPKLAVLAAILPAMLLPATASAASDYLFVLDGIPGESSSQGHEGTIEITSWSLGASNPTSAGSSGMSAGKVSYSDLSVMISLEKAPLGLKAGTKIPVVEIKAGDDKRLDYLTIKLEEVMVSSYTPTAGGGARLSLNYAKIEFKYTPIDDKNRVGTGKTMAAEVIA